MSQPAYGTPTEHNADIAVVFGVYEAFDRRDIQAALRHFHEDAKMVAPGTAAAVGRTGAYHGHMGLAEYFADVTRVWDELELHPEDVRAVSGSIIVFGHVTGRTGDTEVQRRVVWSWRVRDGRITSVHVHDVGESS